MELARLRNLDNVLRLDKAHLPPSSTNCPEVLLLCNLVTVKSVAVDVLLEDEDADPAVRICRIVDLLLSKSTMLVLRLGSVLSIRLR